MWFLFRSAGTLQFIDGLPSPDRPEVFGLSLDAAHHHRDTREAGALLDALLRALERGPRGRARGVGRAAGWWPMAEMGSDISPNSAD